MNKNLEHVCPSSLTRIGPLLLFLVLGFGLFPSQGALIHTIQPFSRLGLFNDHVSYAHMGLTLDFEPFWEYLSLVKKTLKSVEYKRIESYRKSIFSRLLSCVEEIRGMLSSRITSWALLIICPALIASLRHWQVSGL